MIINPIREQIAPHTLTYSALYHADMGLYIQLTIEGEGISPIYPNFIVEDLDDLSEELDLWLKWEDWGEERNGGK